jgi:hypothetical protein
MASCPAGWPPGTMDRRCQQRPGGGPADVVLGHRRRALRQGGVPALRAGVPVECGHSQYRPAAPAPTTYIICGRTRPARRKPRKRRPPESIAPRRSPSASERAINVPLAGRLDRVGLAVIVASSAQLGVGMSIDRLRDHSFGAARLMLVPHTEPPRLTVTPMIAAPCSTKQPPGERGTCPRPAHQEACTCGGVSPAFSAAKRPARGRRVADRLLGIAQHPGASRRSRLAFLIFSICFCGIPMRNVTPVRGKQRNGSA